MKISLVFHDWQDHNFHGVYNTEQGLELSFGDLHSGSMFDGEIQLDADEAAYLRKVLTEGQYRPVFYILAASREGA